MRSAIRLLMPSLLMVLASTSALRRLSNSGSVNGVLGRLRGRATAPGLGNATSGVRASLTTALAGLNNDMVFMDRNSGTTGNAKRVRIVVAGNSTPLTVSRSGDDFTINSATDGGGVATSTPNTIIAAWQANPDLNSRVSIAKKVGDDGSVAVVALAFTNLTGGT